jgi:hypothetical protein
MTQIPSTTNANDKSAMAPIASFSNRVRRMLGLSLHGWENAMVVFLIVAGFFALIAGAATWAVVRLQRIELAESKEAFERYQIAAAKELASARSDADAKIGMANADIAKANAAIAIANERTAEARRGAAEAQRRAAESEKQTAELREKVASRRITQNQHKILVEELSKFPAPFDMALMGDPESALYANDILKTFADARWVVGQKEMPLGGDMDRSSPVPNR